MRSTKSRSRGNKNRNRSSGGNIVNRVFDSSGPDGKVRGTPQQIIEKYNQLHGDAVLSGDRVDSENYAQHAEHYTRLLSEAQREMEARREEQERQHRERNADRDRDRNERLRAQEDQASGDAGSPAIDVDEGDSGLVDTPESAKPRDEDSGGRETTRRQRAPRGRAKRDAAAQPDAAPPPDEDEGAGAASAGE